MLRIVTVIGVGFVFVSSAFAQMGAMPRPYMGLSGLIHTVREEAYNCTGNPAEKPWRVNEVTYDRRGNETWRAYYNADGSVGNQVSHTFDADGNETGWTAFNGKSEVPPAGLHTHADFILLNGKVISSVAYKEDTPVAKSTLDYDQRGNKIREVTVQIGCCTTTWTFKYDAKNRMIETTSDANGLDYIQRLAYDANGNVIRDDRYEKGNLAWTTVRTFDGSRLVKEVITSSDGNIRTTLNTYNKAGNLYLTNIDDASITSTTTIEYYDNGNIRSKDRVTVAKVGGRPQDSEASPTPGRILEKYDIKGKQTERYIYDAKGDHYSTQLSSYDDLGRQTRLIDTSRLYPEYNRDLVYEHDSHGNQTAAFCRNVTPTGDVKLFPSEKRTITYHDK